MKTIVFIALLLTLIVVIGAHSLSAQDWKIYPYHQEGSVIYFPEDEGWHPSELAEWWYTCAHLTGESTGTEYSVMLTYFYNPDFGFDGFRIFNISDETNGQFYAQTLPCNYISLAQEHLNIQAYPLGSVAEEWVTLEDTLGNLIPFEYHLSATSENGAIDLLYNTIKRPLMVGGTGFLYQGASSYTYYYSQTMLDVSGTLTLNDITEPVTGTAWLDRQYGEFDPSEDEDYEWFCIQLSNGMDLNICNIFDAQNQIPDTLTYKLCSIYINDSTYTATSDFEITRVQYSFMPDSVMCYSQQWCITLNNIDLTITTQNQNNEVLLPFRFYEGSTTVQGMVDSIMVTGVGFAELLHSYENPDIQLIAPNGNEIWDGSEPVIWQLLNPDDGRPVLFDLELSTDNCITYNPIAQGLIDTLYYWDISGIEEGTVCWLKVTGYSLDSTLVGFDETDASFVIGATSIDEYETSIPGRFGLSQNYPNPFNPKTTISFNLTAEDTENTELIIYNLKGQKIRQYSIFPEQSQAPYGAGNNQSSIVWDGKDDSGKPVANGIYFYKLSIDKSEGISSERTNITKKMIILK